MTGVFDAEANTWTAPYASWRLYNLHPVSDECRIDGCMVHNPDEAWIGNREDWPYARRADGRMERICPHGVGHPDPNAARFLQKTRPGIAPWSHGCDGCCYEPKEAAA